MEPQFCKVGRITPSAYISHHLQKLESEYEKFMEQAQSLMHNDSSISDSLFSEASRLKKKILTLKKFI